MVFSLLRGLIARRPAASRSSSAAKRPSYRARLEMLEDRLVPSTLFVDDDHAQRPSAQYTSIGAAVGAAQPGDTIRVLRERITSPSPSTRL